MVKDQFAMPVQQVSIMLVVLALVLTGSLLSASFVEPIFQANRYLNGVIIGVFFVGVLACFWQVFQIVVSVVWFEKFLEGVRGDEVAMSRAPRLVAPLAGMLGSSGTGKQISTNSARSILESVASRMDEARDNSRYLSNLLIFLGLLGTFYGLAITVPAVVETIRSLEPSENESGVLVFSRLMDGLEDQLSGMGTAFSSSLLGLAGSLVVGLLDLFAGQAQNRFYRQLEEWISGITKVGFAQSFMDGDGMDVSPSSFEAAGLLEHVAELHRLLATAESERTRLNSDISRLVEAVAGLTERIERQTAIQQQEIDTSNSTSQLLKAIAERQKLMAEEVAGVTVDLAMPEAREHLANIDAMLGRLFEENLNAKQELVYQLHAEFTDLADVMRSLSDSQPDQPHQSETVHTRSNEG